MDGDRQQYTLMAIVCLNCVPSMLCTPLSNVQQARLRITLVAMRLFALLECGPNRIGGRPSRRWSEEPLQGNVLPPLLVGSCFAASRLSKVFPRMERNGQVGLLCSEVEVLRAFEDTNHASSFTWSDATQLTQRLMMRRLDMLEIARGWVIKPPLVVTIAQKVRRSEPRWKECVAR